MRKPLDQVALLQIVMGMKSGQALKLTRDDLYRLAQGSLSSMFDTVRDSDIQGFVQSIAENWEVSISMNLDGSAVLRKV